MPRDPSAIAKNAEKKKKLHDPSAIAKNAEKRKKEREAYDKFSDDHGKISDCYSHVYARLQSIIRTHPTTHLTRLSQQAIRRYCVIYVNIIDTILKSLTVLLPENGGKKRIDIGHLRSVIERTPELKQLRIDISPTLVTYPLKKKTRVKHEETDEAT